VKKGLEIMAASARAEHLAGDTFLMSFAFKERKASSTLKTWV
jgi:hypothetical protein